MESPVHNLGQAAALPMSMVVRWHHDPRTRLAVAVAAGCLTAVVVVLTGNAVYAPLLGWSAAAIAYFLVTWLSIGRMDADATAAHATREMPGELAVHVLLVLAAIGSLAGIALLIVSPSTTRLTA
ncbi:MAG: DUF1345 domain-containing protein, partial [Cellulomonadaceae bacterium]|nr:DUF1345 domain-containing protein [Cellulomonadaceae bacterium]